jgi:hypothetical protein
VKFAHLDGNMQKQEISHVKETQVRQHRFAEQPAGIATREQVRLKPPTTQVATT